MSWRAICAVVCIVCTLSLPSMAGEAAAAETPELALPGASSLPRVSVSYEQFSPNSDGYRDSLTISVTLPKPAREMVRIVDAQGRHVGYIHDFWRRSAGTYQYELPGMMLKVRGERPPLPDGTYYVEAATRSRNGQVARSYAQFRVNRTLKDVAAVTREPSYDYAPLYFSPDGDDRKDDLHVKFRVQRPATVTLDVHRSGRRVWTVSKRFTAPGEKSLRWEGQVEGRRKKAPNGEYTLRLSATPSDARLAAAAGQTEWATPVHVDRTAPTTDTAILVRRINPGAGEVTRVAYTVTEPSVRRVAVVDSAGRTVHQTDWETSETSDSFEWDGRDSSGQVVAPGNYAIQMYVQDRAGNLPEYYPVVRALEVAAGPLSATADVIPWSGWWYPQLEGGKWPHHMYDDGGPMAKYDQVNGTSAWEWEYENDRTTDPKDDWWGHCQAWAAASIMEPQPRARTVGGVSFSQDDVEALYIETWSEHRGYQYGIRYREGGKRSEAYMDVHPAVFDEQVRYWIGEQKTPLIMDFTTGEEVWNYPVYAFERSSTFDGDAEYVTMTVTRAEPVYGVDGTVSREHTFYYTLRPGTNGVWSNPSGSSVDTHPDYVLKVTQRQDFYGNPHVSVDVLDSMFR